MRWLAGLALLSCLSALPVEAESDAPWLVDGIPAGPSVAERAAEIARRVQGAVVYPELARRRGIEGTTLLRFRVSGTGRAIDLETADSSGSNLLDEAAEQGARIVRDLPAIYGRVEVPIRFALDESGM